MKQQDYIRYVHHILAPEGFLFELIQEKHTPYILKWRNNPRYQDYFISFQNITEEGQKAFLKEYHRKDRLDFVLSVTVPSLPIGVFSLKNISIEPEVGQFIGDDTFQGRGLGKAATLALLRFSFETLDLPRLYARVNQMNIRNLHLLKKIGFIFLKEEKYNQRSFDVLILDNKKHKKIE